MILNKNLAYITTGVFLEKALPFIISFFFIKKIDDLDFGIWILYFQIVIIFSSTILSPIQLFFNREFEKEINERINIYNSHIIILILTISLISFFTWGNSIFIHAFLGLLTVVTLTLNNLIFNYLRFTGKNFYYFLFSFLRTIIFITFLVYSVYANNNISIENLFYSYIFSNLLVIFIYKGKLNLKFKPYKIKEFSRLCIYGILTISLGGLDKLILLETNLDVKDLAVMGYALVFANSTNVIVEGFKKYFSPIFFNDFKKNNFYSAKTISKTIRANIFLFIIQISFPFVLFHLIDYFSLIKQSLVYNDFFNLIFVFSLSLFIYNIYHFSNPYIFFKDKSHVLSVLLVVVGLFFVVLVLSFKDISLIKIANIKLITSFILATGTLLISIFYKSEKLA